jgi:hypothetical protein
VTTTTPGIQLRPGGQRGWPPAAGRSGTVACLAYRAGNQPAGHGTRPPHSDDVLILARNRHVSGWSSTARPCGSLAVACRRSRRRVPDALLASRPVNPDPPLPMLRIKERLLRAWLAGKRLTELSFPRRFPIVQFPNLPLIVAALAGEAGKFLDGSAHSYAASVSYLAMTIWAYEELVHGVNWFRRLLGLAYLILLVVRVADGLHP